MEEGLKKMVQSFKKKSDEMAFPWLLTHWLTLLWLIAALQG